MALKKSEKRMLGLLGIVVIVFLINQFVLGSGDKKPEADAGSSVSKIVNNDLSNLGTSGNSSPSNSNTQKKYFESWGRDPFSTATSSSAVQVSSKPSRKDKKPKPILKGIIRKKGKAYVLINGLILGEGEERGGLKIEKIDGMEVLCSQGSQTYTLHWRESP